MRRAILNVLLAGLLAVAGCSQNQGPPYAFRLMIPPTADLAYLPYWFWKQVSVFEKFMECERARKARIAEAQELLAAKEEQDLGEGFKLRSPKGTREERRGWARDLYAQCVPLR